MKPYLILILFVAMVARADDTVLTNKFQLDPEAWTKFATNAYWNYGSFAINTNVQPEILKVQIYGYTNDFCSYSNPSNANPYTYQFNWTNLVCETKFQPVVTKTNDTWYIQFKQ